MCPCSQIFSLFFIIIIIINRAMIYASDTVNNVNEDPSCTMQDCYGACFSIQPPPGLQPSSDGEFLRLFYVRLSEIPSLIGKLDCKVILNSTISNASIVLDIGKLWYSAGKV